MNNFERELLIGSRFFMSKHYVIIVAGGVGSRMNSILPKQFLLLGSRPVLMHSIDRFYRADPRMEIVLVLSSDMLTYWQELCEEYGFSLPHHVTVGGKTRFQSVRSGLDFIKNRDADYLHSLIAVHDGARPLITPEQIVQLFEVAQQKKAVVPAVVSTNSVRVGSQENSEAVDRNTVWQVQTPQVFDGRILYAAYEQEESPLFTDDASVVEKMGNTVFLHEGDYFNLKITNPEDLDIAHIYLAKINPH